MREANRLGDYLRDRRSKLDPAALGFPMSRRRTPGLRREEVAQRSNVSATWYTWLEQGRGGAPSADVLDRIARGLMLTDPEREHLYLLALGRLPEVHYKPVEGISPRLQRVLDSMEFSPALIRTPTWDVVGWNKAASRVLMNYEELEAGQRNILRLIFTHPRIRRAPHNWEMIARTMVAAFRADVARAGAAENVRALIEDLRRASPEFEKMWQSNDVRDFTGGTKPIYHPTAGLITMEFSSFAVDGRPDLNMIVYNPATLEDRKKVQGLLKRKGSA
jgi:transcriptional regulator with XRE-family HTH domain